MVGGLNVILNCVQVKNCDKSSDLNIFNYVSAGLHYLISVAGNLLIGLEVCDLNNLAAEQAEARDGESMQKNVSKYAMQNAKTTGEKAVFYAKHQQICSIYANLMVEIQIP